MQDMALVAARFEPGLSFTDTPFLERIPSTWIPEEDFPLFSERMYCPDRFCSGTVIGTFCDSLGYSVQRFMPCLERIGPKLCPRHTPAPVLPRPVVSPAAAPKAAPPQPVRVVQTEAHPVRPLPLYLGVEDRRPNTEFRVNRRGEWVVGGRVYTNRPFED